MLVNQSVTYVGELDPLRPSAYSAVNFLPFDLKVGPRLKRGPHGSLPFSKRAARWRNTPTSISFSVQFDGVVALEVLVADYEDDVLFVAELLQGAV